MEYLDVLRQKRLKKKGRQNKTLEASKLSDAIDTLLAKYLSESVTEIVFEVDKNYISSAIEVIDKPPLVYKYDIIQVKESLFRATLKQIDLD